jgi:hypothetical protein
VGLDNKRLGEVHGCLGKLPEQLAGGESEREREHELRAAAAMAAEGLGMARWGARRGLNSLGLGFAVTTV